MALTVLGFALAAYRLGSKGLWLDEAVSADHARLGPSGLWTVISAHDPNMGLYYLLLHFWVRVFGYSEAAVRSLTVLLGGLAVPALAMLGTRLFGRTAGLLTGLLLATSPFFLRYEQTARSYALVVLLVTLSSYFFVAELENPSRSTRVRYVMVSVLSIYAHYFAAFVLLVHLFTLLALRGKRSLTREWVSAGLAIVVLCAPEAAFAVGAGTGAISWISAPTLSSLVGLPSALAGGKVAAGLLAILACYGFVREVADRKTWRAGFVAAWLIVPVLLDFVLSETVRPLFMTYYLIVVLPAFLLLAAAGVARIPARSVAVGTLVVLVVLAAAGVRDWYARPSSEGYRSATHYILANEQPGDAIVEYPSGSLQGPTSGIAYYEALAGKRGPKSLRFEPAQASVMKSARVWLVIRDSDVAPRLRRQLGESIAATYKLIGAQPTFANLTVVLYRLKMGSA